MFRLGGCAQLESMTSVKECRTGPVDNHCSRKRHLSVPSWVSRWREICVSSRESRCSPARSWPSPVVRENPPHWFPRAERMALGF